MWGLGNYLVMLAGPSNVFCGGALRSPWDAPWFLIEVFSGAAGSETAINGRYCGPGEGGGAVWDLHSLVTRLDPQRVGEYSIQGLLKQFMTGLSTEAV